MGYLITVLILIVIFYNTKSVEKHNEKVKELLNKKEERPEGSYDSEGRRYE